MEEEIIKNPWQEEEEKIKQIFKDKYGKWPTPNELQQYKNNRCQVSWSKRKIEKKN